MGFLSTNILRKHEHLKVWRIYKGDKEKERNGGLLSEGRGHS